MKILNKWVLLILFIISGNSYSCPSSPAIEASECLRSEISKSELSLASAYKKLMSLAGTINDPGKAGEAMARTLLTKAHKSWLDYRGKQCAFEGYQEGGVVSYKAVIGYQCILRMTEQRTQVYQQYANN